MEREDIYKYYMIAEQVAYKTQEINPHTKTEQLLALMCNIHARIADMITLQTLEPEEEDESGSIIS